MQTVDWRIVARSPLSISCLSSFAIAIISYYINGAVYTNIGVLSIGDDLEFAGVQVRPGNVSFVLLLSESLVD